MTQSRNRTYALSAHAQWQTSYMSQRKPGSFRRVLNVPLSEVNTFDEVAGRIREDEAKQQAACLAAIREVYRKKPMQVLPAQFLANPAVQANLLRRIPPVAATESPEAALDRYLDSLRSCLPEQLDEMIRRARARKPGARVTTLADEIVVLYCYLTFAKVPVADISRKIELRLGCDRIHVRKVLRSYGISLKALRQSKDEC